MICTICNVDKELKDYYLTNDGIRKCNFCKKCQNLKYKQQRNKYRNENKDKAKVWAKKSYINNSEQRLFRNARYRARISGMEFNITVEDIKIPEFCPILGIEIYTGEGRTGHGASVDRIDNNKGYIKGNVMIISDRANKLKADASPEELKKIYEFYYKLMNKKD